MRILHTADLHLGQIMYQYYDRVDEHDHYFKQLRKWCHDYHPDALLVSGDIFDIQQPSASTKAYFNRTFAELHRELPEMAIVIIAGNHDSASRIEADRSVWDLSGVTLIGHLPDIVQLPTGYIVAVPFMAVHHKEIIQELLNKVAERNNANLPVVLMGHLALSGSDITGHSDIGTLKNLPTDALGTGYDYAALGHLHRPQTLGASLDDENQLKSTYHTPVIRYCGSALHVSCDEQYPHSVSLVELPTHESEIELTRLRIDELRHFYTLPPNGTPAAKTADELYILLKDFCNETKRGYLRLRVDFHTPLPSDFQQTVYSILETTGNEVRYNPNIIWENQLPSETVQAHPTFEVAELQQMTDPLDLIRKTMEQYPDLSFNELEADFQEVERLLNSLGDKQK